MTTTNKTQLVEGERVRSGKTLVGTVATAPQAGGMVYVRWDGRPFLALESVCELRLARSARAGK